MSSFRKACIGVFFFCGLVAVVVETAPKGIAPSIVHVAPAPKIVIQPETAEEKFQYAMKVVIRHEGGLSNSKLDKGSWTRYGISLRYLQHEKFDLNGDGIINKDDVIQLTQTEADKIYYKEWYIKNHYDKIYDKDVLTDIMDFSINVGASQCHKTLKRAINTIINDPVAIDGTFDDETIQIVNLIEPMTLHEALNEEQEKFYRLLVKNNPALSVFLKGWILRSRD